MPIYEYECNACRKVIEQWQSISEPPLTVCPECSGDLKKLISMSSFQLKGGGWYADGYSSTNCGGSSKNGGSAKCNGGKNGSSTKSDGCKSSTSSSTSSESKPSCATGKSGSCGCA